MEDPKYKEAIEITGKVVLEKSFPATDFWPKEKPPYLRFEIKRL